MNSFLPAKFSQKIIDHAPFEALLKTLPPGWFNLLLSLCVVARI
jgi:hypothetical protein